MQEPFPQLSPYVDRTREEEDQFRNDRAVCAAYQQFVEEVYQSEEGLEAASAVDQSAREPLGSLNGGFETSGKCGGKRRRLYAEQFGHLSSFTGASLQGLGVQQLYG